VRIFWLMGDFNIPTNLAASLIVLSFILKNFGEKIKHKYKDNFQI
jgi:flagellar biosynthesis regulator FlaF